MSYGFAAGSLLTMTYSWMNWWRCLYGRLASKGFDTAPAAFTALQVAAPVVLVVLSTEDARLDNSLTLTSFASEMSAVSKVIVKSLSVMGLPSCSHLHCGLRCKRFLQSA